MKKYFTGIYSFEEVLEILCMRKKNQDIFLLENLSKWYILMSILKLIYFNCCSYGGAASLFNDFLNEGGCV